MALTLYFHPLASFCWKVLIALYENDTPFTSQVVDLMDERERAEFLKISPFGQALEIGGGHGVRSERVDAIAESAGSAEQSASVSSSPTARISTFFRRRNPP